MPAKPAKRKLPDMDEQQKLQQLIRDHGDDWQIERNGPVWCAVERPEPAVLILHCAYTLDELREKIERTM